MLCELDETWDCVHLQTSWIFKPCTKPVDIDITDPISNTQTGDKLLRGVKVRVTSKNMKVSYLPYALINTFQIYELIKTHDP